MKRIGVIGYPLKHSLSAAFQQAALQRLHVDARYEQWEVPGEGLAALVQQLRQPDHLGASVTIPHKEAIIPLLDELDASASRAGAVNTIVNRDGRLHGYNTDGVGFLRGLREDAHFQPNGCRAVVLGAGGAARAVVLALLDEGAASVTVINRTFSRASRLVEELRPHAAAATLNALPSVYASLATALVGCQLLINCTSVGMMGSGTERETPLPAELIPSQALVYDLVYNPAQTRFLTAAKRRGARTLGGLPMLVYQGAASFELWTGQPAPLDIMFQAARKALSSAKGKGGE